MMSINLDVVMIFLGLLLCVIIMLTICIRKKSLPDSNYVSRIAPAHVVGVQAAPCPVENSAIEVCD